MREKQYVLYCPHCGFVLHFFSREERDAYGDRPCIYCRTRMKRKTIRGEPDEYTGYIPFEP